MAEGGGHMSILDMMFVSAAFITIVAAVAVTLHFTINYGE